LLVISGLYLDHDREIGKTYFLSLLPPTYGFRLCGRSFKPLGSYSF